jgi:hypothetical protein
MLRLANHPKFGIPLAMISSDFLGQQKKKLTRSRLAENLPKALVCGNANRTRVQMTTHKSIKHQRLKRRTKTHKRRQLLVTVGLFNRLNT